MLDAITLVMVVKTAVDARHAVDAAEIVLSTGVAVRWHVWRNDCTQCQQFPRFIQKILSLNVTTATQRPFNVPLSRTTRVNHHQNSQKD